MAESCLNCTKLHTKECDGIFTLPNQNIVGATVIRPIKAGEKISWLHLDVVPPCHAGKEE